MRRFARRRLEVWDARLTIRQDILRGAINRGDHVAEMAAENLVNAALIKKRRWKRRAGA